MPQPSAVTITAISTAPATGRYGAGTTITFALTPSKALRVMAGQDGALPYLTLNDGGAAGYTGQDGSGNLLFAYMVTAGQHTADLVVTGLQLNGATVAHPGAVSFAKPAAYAAGSSPASVSVTDVNGDGKPDLVATNFTDSGTISVLLGNGGGSFESPVAYAAGRYPYSAAVADVNGDGKPDLVVTDYGIAAAVLLGDGIGGFASPATDAAGSNPNSVAVADVDGDGKLDLVVANDASNGVISVLLGDGVGGFAAPASYAAGSYPRYVRVADVNGDGKPDAIVANGAGPRSTGPGTVSILLGLGSGGFASPAAYAAGKAPVSFEVADVNGDGRPDLVVTDYGNAVSVLLGNGSGGFAGPATLAVGRAPTSVGVADVDGDDKLDLVVADYFGIVSILPGDGRGGFASPTVYTTGGSTTGGSPISLGVSDVSGDGKPDLLLTGNDSDAVSVLLNTSTPMAALDPTSVASASGRDTGLAIHTRAARSDVDGDGHGDLIWQNGNGAPSVWAMSGGPGGGASVGAYLNYDNPGASWRLVGAADLNGDGRADLLWQNADGTPSGWLVAQGGGSVTGYPVYANPGSSWRLVGGADLDGDGRADLLWQNSANGAVSAWITAAGGTGVAAYVNFDNPGTSWRLVGGGDLNGDGKSDLVFQNGGGTPAAWLMGGSLGAPAVSAYATFGNPGADWRLVGTADLNGDGRDDMLWQNANGLPSGWLMGADGASVQGYPTFSNPGADWRLAGATDANGDGRADLVWQNASGLSSLWIMGAGGASVEVYPVLNNPGSSWQIREG